jgi:peptidylprolyl isomerase
VAFAGFEHPAEQSSAVPSVGKPSGILLRAFAGFEHPKKDKRKMRKTAIFIMAGILIAGLLIGGYFYMAKGKAGSEGAKSVLLKTNMGDITIELYSDMPITAGNFEKLVREGFYDGIIFHRVIEGFMIQGGDPLGNGMGGPGYMIKDEFTENSKNDRGTISMANAGPNTGGSQFFINLVDNNFLDGRHPAFGKVISGMDVVDKIGKVKTDANDKPLSEVKILKAEMAE